MQIWTTGSISDRSLFFHDPNIAGVILINESAHSVIHQLESLIIPASEFSHSLGTWRKPNFPQRGSAFSIADAEKTILGGSDRHGTDPQITAQL